MSSSTATSSNNISSALIPELKQEAATTRKCLERVPAEKFDWKPHDKSMTFARLASHLGEMFGWTKPTIEQGGIDFATMDYKPFEPKTNQDLLDQFDQAIAESLAVLEKTSDETF